VRAAAVHSSCVPSPSIDRACRHRPSIVRAAAIHRSFAPPISIVIPPPPINHDAAVHLSLTVATTARVHQIAAEALLGLVPEATADVEFVQEEGSADDELIVGLIDSLSIGDSDDKSMEDPVGDVADGNGADGNEADGDREDINLAMNGLRQMGQQLINSTSLNHFLMMSPATSSGEGMTTMSCLCLTCPILQKGVTWDPPMDPAWRPRREACNYSDRIGVIIPIVTHIN
jgi:hypothetical protein